MKELTIQEAEKLAGCRLDRRRRYATTEDGKPCETTGAVLFSLGRWTQPCSGCHETIDGYERDGTTHDKNGIALGSGCCECGYTGKVRVSMWLPHDIQPNGALHRQPEEGEG